jgi:hypothetical protein
MMATSRDFHSRRVGSRALVAQIGLMQAILRKSPKTFPKSTRSPRKTTGTSGVTGHPSGGVGPSNRLMRSEGTGREGGERANAKDQRLGRLLQWARKWAPAH